MFEVSLRLHLSMASLTIKLTPPPKGSHLSNMSPSTFLTSKEAMAPLKRKAHFNHLSSDSRKKLRLDPAPVSGDSTITIYHERTQALMSDDRDKLHIGLPFEAELYEFKVFDEQNHYFQSMLMIVSVVERKG